jgi:hypothetical protein
MSTTIDRSQPIAITLVAEQWQAVMQVLSNGPYNVVAPLIGQIQQQCMAASTRLPMNGGEPDYSRPET